MLETKQEYSATRMLIKLDGLDSFFDEEGKIRDELKFSINNSTFNIHNSKFPSNPNDKFETLLFLPEGEGREGEGGLRTNGYLKSSYKLVDGDWYICDFNGEIKVKVPDDIRKKIDDYLQSTKHQLTSSNNQSAITNNQLQVTNNQSQISSLPLISVITVVFNGEKYLKQTIQSVINQTYPNVEYIIIDGGSTDGTLDIIRKYEHAIDYWVSERDKGIYDAMNKGIDLANGMWINFMNSGDKFNNENVVKNIYLMCAFIKDNDVIFGDVNIDFGNYEIEKKARIHKINFYMPFQHQSTFTKSLMLKNIKFNGSFKLAADYDLFLKLYKDGRSFFYTPIIISKAIAYGFSDTNRIQSRKEYYQIQKMHNLSTLYSTIYYYHMIILETLKKFVKIILPEFMVDFIRILKNKKRIKLVK